MTLTESATRINLPPTSVDRLIPLVTCHVTHETALRTLGPPTFTDSIEDRGVRDLWAFEFSCGLQIVYEFLHGTHWGTVKADALEIQHVMRHLAFSTTDCAPIDSQTLEREVARLLAAVPSRKTEFDRLHSFQVWRQDDPGNSFQVGEPTSERDARCWVRELESHGHKQVYWYTQR